MNTVEQRSLSGIAGIQTETYLFSALLMLSFLGMDAEFGCTNAAFEGKRQSESTLAGQLQHFGSVRLQLMTN